MAPVTITATEIEGCSDPVAEKAVEQEVAKPAGSPACSPDAHPEAAALVESGPEISSPEVGGAGAGQAAPETAATDVGVAAAAVEGIEEMPPSSAVGAAPAESEELAGDHSGAAAGEAEVPTNVTFSGADVPAVYAGETESAAAVDVVMPSVVALVGKMEGMTTLTGSGAAAEPGAVLSTVAEKLNTDEIVHGMGYQVEELPIPAAGSSAPSKSVDVSNNDFTHAQSSMNVHEDVFQDTDEVATMPGSSSAN